MNQTKALEEFRAEFPGLAKKSYFNFGGQGVLPRKALDAIVESYEYVQREGPFSKRMFGWLQEEEAYTKKAFAELLGCSVETLALTHNATEGCNIAMWGVEWQRGDHMLLTDSEHIGIEAIAEVIEKRLGVEVTYAPLADHRNDPLETIRSHVKSNTKLVVLSHVLWNTGRVLPIKEISAFCRDKGIWLLVDGAQSAGAMPVNLSDLDVDFYAVTAHKWMCGPEGVGAFYVRKALIDQLQPTFVGWRGGELDSEGHPTATKYEVATSAFPLLAGLREALRIHEQWGTPSERYHLLKENADYLKKELHRIGAQLLCPSDDTVGLVSFSLPGISHMEMMTKLEGERIMLRTIPKPDCLRASVHYFTTRDEINRLISYLEA